MRPILAAPALLLALAVAACSPAAEPQSVDAPTAPAPPMPPSTPPNDPALGAAIASVLGEDAASTRLVTRFAGDGVRLALVYLVGPNWCGTGGCNLLILRQGATGWEQVGNVGRVRLPVRVLAQSTNGLPDLGVTVSGGGGPPAYEARLAFDGRAYPRFPPDAPAGEAQGTVVMTDADIPPAGA